MIKIKENLCGADTAEIPFNYVFSISPYALFGRRGLTGQPAKHTEINDRVAAQTIAAVDAADNLARAVKPLDHRAVRAKRMGLGIDAHAAIV